MRIRLVPVPNDFAPNSYSSSLKFWFDWKTSTTLVKIMLINNNSHGNGSFNRHRLKKKNTFWSTLKKTVSNFLNTHIKLDITNV